MRIVCVMTSFAPGRAETRSISVATSPEQVFDYLADPRHVPEWAPGFASAIEHDHDEIWRVHTEAGPRQVVVKAAKAHGVVDVVSADAPNLGLFTRVVPNLTGAELIFSLFFPADTDPAAVDAQMAVVDQELRAVRERVER
ncbi:SRPBCC family protein [Amycolatopsis stemonae]